MKVLQVENISKSFGNLKAVDQLSFEVGEGVIFGLLGPNGAGKTTTIRMINNIIIPDSGRISILNHGDFTTASNHIGYLPEERGLYRKMKVGELLLFLARLKAMPKGEAQKDIDYWLQRLDLMEWKKKKVEELSKGMQQKLQFIGTILHKPKLLILDEPFMGLDPINTNLIKDIMLELKNNGATIIFSTHLMESAEKLCDEILLINKGKNVLSGRLAEVKKRFGRENVVLEFHGDDGFLRTSDQIKKYDYYGNFVEIQLQQHADPQKLLIEAMRHAQIRKFEIKEPSLNEIFIETVGNTQTISDNLA
ncbi:MAG: ATP-binding cassette domain-containing protein [candidate division KSB1 bacterium]|nr:ATP-binding cassette domain-containing protein [candidate division KSB1 bacterium]MDZ7335086.1 ATP-binding cassette domain-containing protein [candidate division KSB1 bacterium]MDZ7356245.1 ATP-binding cassette domain-containing protein [candidate division KSB1 bacterium]MDZ7375771.1 ATP-binding cassette domain-containing protein [candidate division KSB1 bacterium]MDZ7400050.1 ATP-binding cassette domain-containing protein [candidate division KSB1 bacterium]